MCIYGMRKPEPEERQGIGYKVVRPAGLITYLPEWLHFRKDGMGGCAQADANTYSTRVQYVLDRWYRVRHKHSAFTNDSGKRYRAGVHLYLKKPNRWEHSRHEVVIKCQYRQAVAIGWSGTDCARPVVVALAVKPLEEVKDGNAKI